MNSDSQHTGAPSIFANLSRAIAMKLKPISAAGLFAIMAALVLNACAAPGALADAEPQTKMRPHSHLREKTGLLPTAPMSTEALTSLGAGTDDSRIRPAASITWKSAPGLD